MLNFKKLKDQLIKEFVIEDGGDDLAELGSFAHGLDVMHIEQFKYIRDLEDTVDFLRAENKRLKKQLEKIDR